MRAGLGNAEAQPTAGALTPGATGHGTEAVGSIRYVGDKTFLCQKDVCTDTAYVPDKMTPLEVPFMSEVYWQLTTAQPTLSAYFAVGQEVFFVAEDGKAYHFRLGTETEIVPRPETTPTATGSLASPSSTPTAVSPTASPSTPTSSPASSSKGGAPGVCGGASLAVIGVVLGLRGKHRNNKNVVY